MNPFEQIIQHSKNHPIKNTTWVNQALSVVADVQGVQSHVRELIKKYQWKVYELVTADDQMAETLLKQNPDIIVVDDSNDQSTAEILNLLRSSPQFMFKPVIPFLSSSWNEYSASIQKAYTLFPVVKPMTITKFASAFEQTVKFWGSPLMSAFRQADQMTFLGDRNQALKIFEKFETVDAIKELAAIAVARHYEMEKNFNLAEKKIIQLLKADARALAAKYYLAKFYIRQGMLYPATKLLENIKLSTGNSPLFDIECIVAHLQQGKLDFAFQNVMNLKNNIAKSDKIDSCVMKILFSEGRLLELEHYFSDKKGMIQSFAQSWDDLEKAS